MGQFTAKEFLQNFLGCFADFKQSITFLSFRPDYYVNGYPNYLFAAMNAIVHNAYMESTESELRVIRCRRLKIFI